MRPICGVIICFLSFSTASVFDKELSPILNGIAKEDELILVFKKVDLPKRGLNGTHQLLLSIGDPPNTQISFILDRKHGKVSVETVIDAKSYRDEFDTKEVSRNRIKLLFLEIQQKNKIINIYLDCKLVGKLKLIVTIKDLVKHLGKLKLYRDNRSHDLSIEGNTNILDLMEKIGCHSSNQSNGYQSQANDLYTYKRVLRCQNLHFGHAPCPTFTEQLRPTARGDIPASHADKTTSLLVNTMNDLADTIRQLQSEIQSQREETALLRDTLANCEACKSGRDDYFRG